MSRDDFKAALAAEGTPAGGPCPGKPLYQFDSLTQKIAFGASKHPWDVTDRGRRIEYKEGVCPNGELVEKQLVTIGINEFYSKEDIQDISKAVHKVARHYTKR